MSFAAFCDFSYFEEVHPLAQNRRGSCIKQDFLNSKHIVVYKYFKGMVSLLNHIFKMCITVVSFYNLYTRKWWTNKTRVQTQTSWNSLIFWRRIFFYKIIAIKRILHLFSWFCPTEFFFPIVFYTSDNFHKTNVSLTTPPLDRLQNWCNLPHLTGKFLAGKKRKKNCCLFISQTTVFRKTVRDTTDTKIAVGVAYIVFSSS